MSKLAHRRAIVPSILLCLSGLAFAQVDTGSITGTATDPSGAVLPGVTITAVNEDTGIGTQAVTNQEGNYVITPLRVGRYTLTGELPGFKKEVRAGIVLRIQERLKIDIGLQVGEIAEEVVITSRAPLLETETSSLGQVMTSETIENLPLNGRNFIQLAQVSAGVLPSYQTVQRDNFIANGNRPIQNSYILDGMDNKAHIVGFDKSSALTHKPSVDAIQEFKVQTSTFSAEYGQGAGAVVNATLKSGTNSLHGSLFEFHRNSALDATPYFQPPNTKKPLFIEHQFGGTAGGPIRRNRTFLFFSYEGTRLLTAAPRITTVPTDALREGRFGTTRIFDPGTTKPNPAGSGFVRDPFAGSVVPRLRWDPVAARLVELYPRANLPGNILNHFYNPRQRVQSDQVDLRLDHKLNEAGSLFVRFSLANDVNTLPPPLPPPANDLSKAFIHGRSFVLGYTRSFSPRMVNEFRGGFNRTLLDQDIDTPRRFEEFGIKGAVETPEIKGLPTFAVSGFQTLGTADPAANLPVQVTGSGNLPITKAGQNEIVSDTVSLVRGDHGIKFGGEVRWNKLNANVTLTARPSFNFNGVFTQDPQRRAGTGHAFADFLLGLTNTATASTQSRSGLRSREYLFFLQDDWKVTRRLTLNLGVRYELITPSWEVNDQQSNFILDRTSPDFGKIVIAGARGSSIKDRAFSKLDKNNIAPRLGFAWQFASRTVLRGGFGIFYGRDEDIGVSRRLTNNPPFFVRIPFPTDQITPVIVLSTGFPAGILNPANMINPEVNNYPEDFPLPYVQQWSLNLERELPGAILLQAGYVGSSSVKLWLAVNVNRPPPGQGAVDPRRPIRGFGNVFLYNPYIKGNYHSLFVKTERRFSGGLSFINSYTLGHSIDNGKFMNESGADIQDFRNLRAERASSNNDIRHRFISSYIYDLPFGQGRRFLNREGIAGAVLGGWRWTGIASLHSGLPFTPTLNFDPTNSLASARPNRLRDGNLSRSRRTLQRFYDLTAFEAPVGFNFGNSGRNILRGPGFVNFDFGIHRDFRVREGMRIQLRAELFNAFNTPQFDDPAAVIGTAQAGVIQGVRAPERQIQVGLKFVF
ncbi:MAG TPA: TonB-dependent receptor [Acidobacteriota bacterium]